MSKRPGRTVELPEYLSACRRMLRGAGRRVGSADPVDLANLVALRADLDAVIGDAVDAMRADKGGAPGFSWAEIAEALGTSRQNVQQQHARRRAERGAARREVPGQTAIEVAS